MEIKEIMNQLKELETYKDKYERIKEMFDEINPKIEEAIKLLSGITGKKITGTRKPYKTGGEIEKTIDIFYKRLVEERIELTSKDLKALLERNDMSSVGSTMQKQDFFF